MPAKRATRKTSPETTASIPEMTTPVMPMNSESCCDNCMMCEACNSRQKRNWTPLLMVALLVATFFLGSFYTRIQNLQGGQQAMAPQAQQAAAQPTGPTGPVNVSLGHFPVKGDKNAKVTIVEFADMRCPFCEKFFTDVEPQIMKNYVDTGKVKFAFRQYPFLGPASNVAADAVECANNQGKFWDMHDYLYKNQPDESDTSMYNADSLSTIAGQLGMNADQFKQCVSSKQDDSKAQADFSDGQKAGVQGTPTFYINGVQLVGAQPYSAFQAAIDAALAKK